MQYLTSYYWQQEEKPLTSLVLQQLVYRKRKVPVLFACICSVEKDGWGNSYFTEQLTSWFQNQGRKLLVTNRDNEEKIIVQLQEAVRQIDEELEENRRCRNDDSKSLVSVVGVLCVADYYFLFYRGNQKGYLLNYRFGQANCKQIITSEGAQLQIRSGRMEKNIGLLLSTKDFGKGLPDDRFRECLEVKILTGKMRTEEGVEGKETAENLLSEACVGKRHLRELGQVSARSGARHVGAVLLVTV